MTDLIKRDDAPEPCPFCKCEEVTTWFDREQGEKWGYASCDGCAARGPEVRTNWDREPDAPWHSEAIAAWNTRALPAIDPAAIREAVLQARIEELVKERDATLCLIGAAADNLRSLHRAEAAEAKLTKAVEALEDLVRDCEADYPPSHGAIKHFAIATLAEIKGGNDAESNL